MRHCDLYVVRLLPEGPPPLTGRSHLVHQPYRFGFSQPCVRCLRALEAFGVHRVIFSTGKVGSDGEVGCEVGGVGVSDGGPLDTAGAATSSSISSHAVAVGATTSDSCTECKITEACGRPVALPARPVPARADGSVAAGTCAHAGTFHGARRAACPSRPRNGGWAATARSPRARRCRTRATGGGEWVRTAAGAVRSCC